jgi:membrane-associated phospholipid phosphatase
VNSEKRDGQTGVKAKHVKAKQKIIWKKIIYTMSSRCEVTKLLLRVALCIGGLSVAASGQLVSDAALPEAPSAFKRRLALVAHPSFLAPAFLAPGESPQPAPSQPVNRQDLGTGFVELVKRGVQDQKEIYSAPFHRQNLKWDAVFLLTTGGLIAADRHAAGAIAHNPLALSRHISDAGLYSTMATTGVLYLSGIARNDEHAREAGVLGFEALGNTLVVDAATQLISGRERPLEGSGHGRFLVHNALSSSFPSQHSGLTWSMASVLAHEYPQRWVQLLAYGTATTVSVTRVTGMNHFPADAVVGGVFGYFIGRHIFHAHSHAFPDRRHARGLHG